VYYTAVFNVHGLTGIQGSVGLVTRFGHFYKSVDPGLVQVNVCTEDLRIVDVKIQISPIGRQTVITRDNVNVEMCVCFILLFLLHWLITITPLVTL
jgi:regulator of protease activity HflC (stomatin/prohibitin superfamily)